MMVAGNITKSKLQEKNPNPELSSYSEIPLLQCSSKEIISHIGIYVHRSSRIVIQISLALRKFTLHHSYTYWVPRDSF